jgi:hypothetical protein
MQTLIEKTETDDKLINALREELEKVRKAKNMPPSNFSTSNEVNNLRT